MEQLPSNPNFSELEKKIVEYWKEDKTFEKSVEFRKEKEFIFYDGPPFANGLPHYGHLLSGFIKDTYARYQTSKGKKVERRFGWDCHGLPAEMQSEKELGIQGRLAIAEFGIGKFNDYCKNSVMKYTNEWEKYVSRQARWVDFENSYKTMDITFMESVIWAFKELYKKGYVYESLRVMPYSWACETPLSNFETKLDNSYRERADKAATVCFKLRDKPSFIEKEINKEINKEISVQINEYKILSWTTTPWTLPSNLALAVNSEIEYVAVKKDNICYIISKSSLAKYKKELGEEIISTFKGEKLVDLEYKPMFDYFENHKCAFRILHGDFVTDTDGTGVVHMAPGFGEDDQVLCDKNDIKVVCPVDNSGKFTSEVYDFAGIQVFDAIDPIIIKIKNQSDWIKTEQYLHNYPHCWRTDTPLIYKAVSSLYVKVTAFKDRMVELNKQINWVPNYVKDGMFGKWLENAKDWSISRNRFFGTPIPLWKSNDPKYPRIDVYGSLEEIEKDFGVKITDLHREFLDKLTRTNPDDPTGKSLMVRCEDVFDCWFESGCMPYGQVHYPFENKNWFETHFPADFIAEYTAQTRGWFYTLMVLSTALFDKPPFLNCVCHGVILDSEGQKLSKRLQNYPDPLKIFEDYGADALRFTMLSSGVVLGQDFLIDRDGKIVYETLRLNIKPIWNASYFLTLYANTDNIKPEINFSSKNILDSYILSKLALSVKTIDASLSSFDSQTACQEISKFFEVLNNWYIRRSRLRFWKSEKDQDKLDAYNTLYTCIIFMMKSSCSLLPLITEEIYTKLTGNRSVHLEDFPDVSKIKIDEELIAKMDKVIDICSSALFIRSQQNIRTRQPLSSLTIASNEEMNLREFEEIISDEVNVKSVIIQNDVESYATTKVSLNFKEIGKRIPESTKEIISLYKAGNWKINDDLSLSVGDNRLIKNEYEINLEPKNPSNTKPLSDKKSVVILNLEITKELEEEGFARDVVRIIQQSRKEADFMVSDKIIIDISGEENYLEICSKYKDYICDQCLGKFDKVYNNEYLVNTDIIGSKVNIKICLEK